eukprot:TRINITY_DN112556_c0_g1_i1.p1 TRINITY_DN112556_c0_g1~~TRINITY_DN112556_c0_g1_i1.p1  ORF type:complete len:713 (+),score=77.26 TRINITY_DN112556_c0_g1_i1:37-2175(+)
MGTLSALLTLFIFFTHAQDIKEYTLAELHTHAVQTNCWTAINSKVYDVTNFFPDHPGGPTRLLRACGEDATNLFKSIHKASVETDVLPKFKIGNLVAPPPETKPIQVEQVGKVTIDQVKGHQTPTDCWTVIDNAVYNLTPYFGDHPGGDSNLVRACGIDSSALFAANHKETVRKNPLPKFSIGTLTTTTTTTTGQQAIPVELSAAEVAKHSQAGRDCWTVISDKVYNVTSYFGSHPGGDQRLATACGVDATRLFEQAKHPSSVATTVLPRFLLGAIQQSITTTPNPADKGTTTTTPNNNTTTGTGSTDQNNQQPSNSQEGQTNPATQNGVITLQEVQKHGTKGDCWTIVNKNVYNLTSFASTHPGGEQKILQQACGKDATASFNAVGHKQTTLQVVLPKYYLAPVDPNTSSQVFGNTSSSTSTATSTTATVLYSMAEVSRHSKSNDCWTAIEGKVYDVTTWFPLHPGGVTPLGRSCGIDSTALFAANHKASVGPAYLPQFLVGTLLVTTNVTTISTPPTDVTSPNNTNPATTTQTELTMAEVEKHNSRSSCWMVHKQKVYDVTSYINIHPGGVADIMRGCGVEATDLFDRHHKASTEQNILPDFLLGALGDKVNIQQAEQQVNSGGNIAAEDAGDDTTVRNVVIVAVACAVFIAVVLAICGVMRCKNVKHQQGKRELGGAEPPFVHYDASTANPMPQVMEHPNPIVAAGNWA